MSILNTVKKIRKLLWRHLASQGLDCARFSHLDLGGILPHLSSRISGGASPGKVVLSTRLAAAPPFTLCV